MPKKTKKESGYSVLLYPKIAAQLRRTSRETGVPVVRVVNAILNLAMRKPEDSGPERNFSDLYDDAVADAIASKWSRRPLPPNK